MAMKYSTITTIRSLHHHHNPILLFLSSALKTSLSTATTATTLSLTTRRVVLYGSIASISTAFFAYPASPSTEFFDLPNSGGVKALDLRIGTCLIPVDGDQVAIHYYGRLAAKQGWRFDSTYDHKDASGDPVPFTFTLGSNKVISGIESAVRSMKVGGVRRVIIPPSQGYQNTTQEPLPPNFFDRQRLFTTIFNPTRLANGEGSTLGTLIFDIELNCCFFIAQVLHGELEMIGFGLFSVLPAGLVLLLIKSIHR